MTITQTLGIVASASLLYVPNLLVAIVGLWLAISRRQRHPRVSRFAMIGYGAYLLVIMIALAYRFSLTYALQTGAGSVSALSETLAATNLASTIINLIAMACVCVAVFIDRPGPADRSAAN